MLVFFYFSKGTVNTSMFIVQQPFLFIYDKNEKSEHLLRNFVETKGKIYLLVEVHCRFEKVSNDWGECSAFYRFGLMKFYEFL